MSLVQDIRRAAAGHGHGCSCDDCLKEYNGRDHYGFDAVLGWRLAAAAVLLIAGLAVWRALPALSTVLYILSILTAGYDFLLRAIVNIFLHRSVDESLLMTVVTLAAVLIGRGAEGAFYMLLLGLGEFLRCFVKEKARRNLHGSVDEPREASGAFSALLRGEYGNNRMEEFIAHFARFYTPIILVIAVLIAVLTPILLQQTIRESVYRALILMVIACPCGVVISVPLAFLAGIGGAARQGAVFRDSTVVEELCRVGAVVFDESTALEGEALRIVSVKSEQMDPNVLLRIAAHACAYGEGRYADSIKAAYRDTIYIELIQSFQQESGRGITVQVDGVDILIGFLEFVRENGIDPGADVTDEPSLYIAIDGRYAGRIVFGGVVSADAPEVVRNLDWEKNVTVAMVSEESTQVTEKIARAAGIGQYYSDCTPDKKASVLRDMKERQLKRGTLVFLGDPDTAPECFQSADVGAAVFPSDTEKALESAGLAITGRNLSALLTGITMSKRTQTIAWQNIIIVLAFKLIVLLLDMLGVCPLWLAMLADVGVALAATANCLRTFFVKESSQPKS